LQIVDWRLAIVDWKLWCRILQIRKLHAEISRGYNTVMRQLIGVGACFIAALVLTGVVSAQYAGWTVPPTAKDEKSPLKPSADLVKRGRAVFTANCQKCHGPEAKGDGPDSDPRSPAADLTDEFRYDLNPEGVLYHKIFDGHPPEMPAFKSQLSRDQIWQVVEYLKSIRKKQ
jgi:mono/diheme cytochrome c family protein